MPGRLHLRGRHSLYIQPDECVDCGACEPVCPVEAIYYEDDLPDKWQIYLADNARFFSEPLPGRHNFTFIPRIRSGRPAFEFDYPHLLERLEAEAHAGRRGTESESLAR